MTALALIFAGIAGLLHVLFFKLESLDWRKPKTWKTFGLESQADADTTASLAFNQGFYNLFLAAGALGGLIAGGDKGHAIALFSCACMTGAGLVLVASDRRMVQAAATQALPPLLALVLAATL